jgi:hypothetical protein
VTDDADEIRRRIVEDRERIVDAASAIAAKTDLQARAREPKRIGLALLAAWIVLGLIILRKR